jgi:sugar lactone lactonase YvrE
VVAGSGDRGAAKDDVASSQTPMNNPTGVAVGPDGTVYVSDSGNHVVRAISTNGTIRTVAGTGQDGTRAPEPTAGAKATDVPLAFPNDLAVGRDGTVFIADGGTIRVYALAPDGTISVRADGNTGNGVLPSPMGAPSGLAVAPDDTLYIADRSNYQIIALSPDGAVRLAAGGMGGSVTDSSGPATETPVGPVTGIAADTGGDLWISSASSLLRLSGSTLTKVTEPVGSVSTVSAGRDGVYVVDQQARVVRRLTPDNRVSTVATFTPTQQPILWAAAGAAPDGPIYLVDNAANRVLAAAIAPAASGGPVPENNRSWWPYAVGAAALLAVLLIGARIVRRRRLEPHLRTETGADHG